jgi:thioredoxin 1
MKITSSFVLLILLLISCGSPASTKQLLSPKEFSQRSKQLPNAKIIDVRSATEFSAGHLPNAINCDWNGNNFNKEISKLNKKDPVFVYCLSGGRSSSAAAHIGKNGF